MSVTASGTAASDESDKTFTVTGLDMAGDTLVEVITGPEANKSVTEDVYLNQFIQLLLQEQQLEKLIELKAADLIVTGQLEMSSSNSFTVIGEDGKAYLRHLLELHH